MKKVTYEFEVPDFCPEQCKAFSPFDYRGGRLGCLNETKCEELYRHLKEMEEKRRDEGIAPYAGEGDTNLQRIRTATEDEIVDFIDEYGSNFEIERYCVPERVGCEEMPDDAPAPCRDCIRRWLHEKPERRA